MIAHRGSSGARPEHSPAAYLLAVEQGADWLEPDLVPTRDGVLLVRHDAGLMRSTDVARIPRLADHRRTHPDFPDAPEDWWAHDFTWPELSELRCRQPWPDRDPRFDGQQPLLRLEQVLRLASFPRPGPLVYPELKHPAAYLAAGIDLCELVLATLAAPEIRSLGVPLAWQCFETPTLERLAGAGVPRLTRLFTSSEPRPPAGALPDYVHALGIPRVWLAADDIAHWVESIHASGRELHAWTFRETSVQADRASRDGLWRAFELGVDAVFCDWPDVGLAQRALCSAETSMRTS